MLNKTKFVELVKNPELIEEKDLPKLDELASEHPYSQIVHILDVKGRKAFDPPKLEESLQRAATYIYDRAILKALIEGPEVVADQVSTTMPGEEVPKEQVVEETSDFEWIHESEDDEDIFIDEIPDHDQVEDQQEQEQETEQEPELESKEIEGPEPEVEPEAEKQEEVPDPKAETEPPAEEPPPVKAPEKDPEPEKEVTDEGEDLLAREIEAGSIHAELMMNLNQLQENKQLYEEQPDKNGGPKDRREQIEIIDNFIKNSPVLSKPNLSAESEGVSQDDLSKNSTKLTEELVSENLAKIYLKQGKGKDAEKIYKKLIRKFPQKKAYFADQIQKIKKK